MQSEGKDMIRLSSQPNQNPTDNGLLATLKFSRWSCKYQMTQCSPDVHTSNSMSNEMNQTLSKIGQATEQPSRTYRIIRCICIAALVILILFAKLGFFTLAIGGGILWFLLRSRSVFFKNSLGSIEMILDEENKRVFNQVGYAWSINYLERQVELRVMDYVSAHLDGPSHISQPFPSYPMLLGSHQGFDATLYPQS